MGASFYLSYCVLKGNWVSPKIGYFPLELYPKLWIASEYQSLKHVIYFAQERWPLKSMIKWTIIRHLSWQYLWAVMLDHCSLSQWSSSSVYSTISLCRSVSDSWYLCIKSVHCWIIYSSASLLEYSVAKLCFSWLMAGVCFSGYSYLAFSFELIL